MTASKITIRKHALEKRDLISAAEAHEAARAIEAAALELVRRLSGDARPAVALYWPIRSELNTRPLIEALHVQGYPVLLPAMTAVRQPLHFRAFTPGDELEKGPFGLSEPAPGRAEGRPEIVFAPLAAFDRRGVRLGYGGGIYDATLKALRTAAPVTAIGLAFSIQESDAIPAEPHDQRLDVIITERETIDCAQKP
jgi:5-formyltetrahydrofolate cyclo-ligase